METSRANVLIHRSDGQTFAMDDRPIGLLELKGVDAPAMEVFTEKNAVGDGDTVTGSRVAARDITIRAKSRGGVRNAILRARAVVFFDPQYTYDVDISYDGVTRTARDCRLKAVAIPSGSLYQPIEITATIAQERITDTRLDTARCGIVAAINSKIDTTALYNQIQADLASFKGTEQAEFLAWFENIKGKLSGDVAANLQAQIEGKQDKITAENAPEIAALLGVSKPKKATASLPVASWAGAGPYTQSAAAAGVTAGNTIVVSPDAASFLKWGETQVRATAQGAGTVTFTAETKPDAALTANILIMEV